MIIPPLAAESIFHLGNFAITNSYINSTIVVLIFLVVGFLVKRGFSKQKDNAPRGFLNFVESLVELLLSYMDKVTHGRDKSIKFLPIVGTLFFFILVSNWMGILPGIGSIGIWQVHQGEVELIPMFRPANADLNMTLAMALFVVTASHFLGIAAIGFFKYANKFIKLGDLWHAFKTLNPITILTAFIEFFVGFIEIISEVAKVLSLSLRLFGNIFAGEVLLTVIGSLIAFFVPLPFIALELLVGVVQALVFAMLTLAYLTVATTEMHSHAKRDTEDIEPTPAF
ncbi:MAG: ATP synthase F0 subunit A [Candidatus Doudnabacteria bacterium RIFCSPHIGHO2_02_FULL_46_11]|uniref:ATP synthase subunit a n=1 Tax=Candidatus Doudnabacteria bacterium RIFCSPHIGHO2_02_FULL_46_11 TaxID=1817832 RepID=A0A1F5P8H7_9BACT|nr:MAG: ATP synthase F0 subunit A [Candidatus Doudnabacteria bacterium RIFCSPHIGHO2_02_FULL_46_11]